jgi:ketosteroid isomerase-like protein
MKIAKLLLTASLLLPSASLIAGQSTLDESAAEKQISGTLHQMYEAEKQKDLNFVFAHLADDFAEVAGDGAVYHRSDIQAGWADVVLKDYKLSDCLFKLMTSDAAYMTCIMDLEATYKGQPLPQRIRVTTVWTRHKDEWLLRFEQGTIIPERKKSSPDTRD